MKSHLSMDADDPERAAKALAWIRSSEAYPSSVRPGSWIVMATEEGASLIDVRPRGAPLQVATPTNRAAPFATATHLSEAEVCALGAAEGWPAERRSRGRFHVIELWIENRVMIEVLTPQMQADYVAASTPQARRAA
jgi:hypothetical protein